MQAKQFWPPTKHKLLYANLIVYGVTIVLLLVFRHELIWAQSAFRFYALSGSGLPPPANNLLLQEAAKYLKTDKDVEQSQRLLEQALQIDPYGQALLLLGVCYLKKGDYEKMQDCYEKYRSIDPSFIGTYTQLYGILEKKQDYEAIDKLLEEGIEHFRRRIELYQPRRDPAVQEEFNLKAVRIYNESRETLKLLEKIQEQSSNLK